MNFLSSVTSARHDHTSQKVLEYFSRFQQQNALLEETLDLPQKENAPQRELTARLQTQDIQQQERITQLQEKVEALEKWIMPVRQTITARPRASLHGHHYGPTLQVFRDYLTDRLMGIGLFLRLNEVIDKVSSLVVVRPAQSQRMRLCQCLGLVIATSASGLSAGMLELPLFFPCASPDNVLSPPHSHCLPVSKRVLPVNTTISETKKETSVLLLPCDQEPCVAWNHGGRVSLLDLAEITMSGESGTAERENRKVREVVQTRDQNGNIIYHWYDQDGHLHTISEWEFKRRLSMYFQSLLEFLYPEYFGSSMPAGGGWHQWQYWKVRRTADRPENTGQQRWPARQARHQPNGQTARPVAAVQPVQQAGFTKYQSRHQNSRPKALPSERATGRTVENEIDRLLMEFESGHMQSTAARHHKNYEGRKHRSYCSRIKNATRTRRKPLTDDEKLRFVPFMRHLSEVVYSFSERSLSTCVHSLVASQLLYPSRSIPGQRTASGGEGRSIKKTQKALIEQLVRTVESRATLQERAPCGFDAQSISNLLWSLAKLVENRMLQIDQGGLASQTVTALLPKVVTPARPFKPQEIANLLWSLAKLVENRLLQIDQGGLASQVVTALLPQVQSHQDDFTSQGVSNLLWALVKLVENGLLQLNQGSMASQMVTALLPQVQSNQDDFTSQGVSNLLWALAKLLENRLLQLDQDGLASQVAMALLSQVVTPPGPFNSQHVSNLLWSLAKLVENGLLQLDQGGLVSQAVMVLLPQVQNYQDDFTSQGVSNLLWSLAKLVENGPLQLDQGGLASQTVAVLLPQVQSHKDAFSSQAVSNLLWSLAKLVENDPLQLDQGGLASQAVMALLSQVQRHQDTFISQHVSNLLWSLAKLVENGLLQLDQGDLVSQVVTALLPQVVTPPGSFKPQEISNLLWALAALGDGVSLNEVFNILRTMDMNTIELWLDQEMTLWALTVFLARGGETSLLLPPMKRFHDALMAEKGNSSDIRASIMWLSGIWLEENLQNLLLPNYQTTVSPSHRELYKILRENFPRHTLEMEASVNGLPPVDLLFSHEKVVVEVQGAYHYIDKEKKLRNGRTILKTSTYEKLGYKVFEISASDVNNRKKRKQLLRELDACFLNKGNSADSSIESDYETAEEDNWFSAEEEP